jgi:tryptophanyl-tRNA synthetase
MDKKVILTGLRANNDLHIGNYFGALMPIVDMAHNRADDYDINLFVPDLHSFTTPIDHKQLYAQTLHNLKLFVAAGLPLDHPNIHLYRQSFVPAHSELTWILDCFSGFGQLQRMTQFKDKSKDLDNSDNPEAAISVGLFNYPVLMAADILLYDASYIPVGDDQTQHIEFARDIAQRMNSKFSEIFIVPKSVTEQHEFFGHDQGLRIKDLVDPLKKMSKSAASSKGVVFLGDDPKDAAEKIMSATTDSVGTINFDSANQPGITNLLTLLALLRQEPQENINAEWVGKSRYGDLKKTLATAMEQFLEGFQTRLASVNEGLLLSKLESDEKLINAVANAKLLTVQKAVGLRQK